MFKMKNYNCFEFQTKNFIVRYEAIEEEYPEDMIAEMDSDLAEEVRFDLQSGESCCFTAEVSVILKDTNEVLGSAPLGGNIYNNYEDFMDHYGLGYTSVINKINNLKEDEEEEEINKLKYALKQIKKTGSSPFGSYFKDLVKGAIADAKTSNKYKKFTELKRKKEKIENF